MNYINLKKYQNIYKGLLVYNYFKVLKIFVGLIIDGLFKDDGIIIVILEDVQYCGKL